MGESKYLQDLLAEAPSVLKQSKARMKRAGLSDQDCEDVAQDAIRRILERDHIYDPAKSKPAAFVQMIAAQARADFVTASRAQKRGGGRRPRSLDAPVADRDDETLGDQCPGRSAEPIDGVVVMEIVGRVPAQLRAVFDLLLQRMTNSEIGEALGMHRTTVAAQVIEIREWISRDLQLSTDTKSTVPVEGPGCAPGRAPKESTE